ncbi:hypothetical protein GCM10011515_20890 [Tsuneonella deserti]|uniref:tRNA(Ile)-lysidine synthase n=1 Tax=Tsuneonella deserti TaxID=2035528 RepID=A0ABQ1SB78_9SPHN|nr:tRNA lysidine(34) synthetase TilS [Tsuneonella deserti]GGE00947.1 hypothetical protein GCM10011515_20890 [Tsuneonella deserti]
MAVSGGPDSLALLLLAHAALPERVIAATIDHGLRFEAAAEARKVAGICEAIGVPHETVRVILASGNLQHRARDARYEALCRSFGSRGAGVFATAHHADDQAETMLMRLNRGSGLAGLAGIRERAVMEACDPSTRFLVVRPLLNWRREELARIVSSAGMDPVSDPSNEDERFDRVRVRQALSALPWLDPLAIARSAAHLQEAESAVEEAVAQAACKAIVREGEVTWLLSGHSSLIELELVAGILREHGANVPRSAVARMIAQLRSDGHASLGGVIARRARHRADETAQLDAWRFEREPPRRA